LRCRFLLNACTVLGTAGWLMAISMISYQRNNQSVRTGEESRRIAAKGELHGHSCMPPIERP
jgi:hypothetical protein